MPFQPSFAAAARTFTAIAGLAAAVPAVAQAPPPAATIVPVPADPVVAAVNDQVFVARPDRVTQRRLILKAQVLLDRRHFSPGVIDGRAGSNLRGALAAFQAARGLAPTGRLDAATWKRLTRDDSAPILRSHVVSAEDAEGPFVEKAAPGDFGALAKDGGTGWNSITERLAERAHMAEPLLVAMNRGADIETPGTSIIVVSTARAELPAVASITVDKRRRQLLARDAAGAIVAAYPATIGSSDRPAPDGDYTVRTVAPAPSYTYDPSRLTFKAKGAGSEKLVIPPGPNNPVGATWIDLSLDTYGIHGTPEPAMIGKTASHGCVRLTNWDAKDLGAAVKAGTRVTISG
jgi:lipoprotein-anchoring transpeptidase ErfK/SrfK